MSIILSAWVMWRSGRKEGLSFILRKVKRLYSHVIAGLIGGIKCFALLFTFPEQFMKILTQKTSVIENEIQKQCASELKDLDVIAQE